MTKADANDGRDKTRITEQDAGTSSKVASESVNGEPQAQAYEPRFKSFSSVRNDVGARDEDEPLVQLMNRVNRPGADRTHGISEFCIEDKELGHFSPTGDFVPNPKEHDLLKKLGFMK